MSTNICYLKTTAGILKVSYTDVGISKATFEIESTIETILPIETAINEKNLILNGTNFQIKVWRETLKIPEGTTISYQELATKIGHPKSSRAVANALAQNKIAYLIPCHRIIRKDGKLGGYKWGIERKATLLKVEQNSY